MNTRTNISLLQLFMIYVNTAYGAGILTLPRTVGSIAREDVWLSVIFGGMAMAFSLWCTLTLSRRFPETTAIEYHPLVLGPVLGQILNIYYLLNLVIIGAAGLRSFSTALKLFLFDLTPPWIITFIFLGVAAYAGQYGIAPLIRMQQFFVFIISPFFITLTLLGFLRVETHHFQPFLAGGLMPVLKGVVPSWFAYSGPEMITGLLFPFVTKKNQVVKMGLASIVVLTVVYTVVTVIVQGVLGLEEIVAMVFPTVIAYREVDIPDTFIERLDGYLLIVHIAIYFISLANLMYFAAFGCSRLMKLEYSRPAIILLVPILYFIAILPQSNEQLNLFYRLVNYIGLSWGLIVSPLVLLIAKLRNRGGCS